MITSRTNEQIKNIRKLLTSKKARDEQGVFVAEGESMVLEAPPERVRKVFVTEKKRSELAKELEAFKDVESVSDEVMKNLSDTVTPQGIAAIIEKQDAVYEDLAAAAASKGDLLVVMLDGVRDPGNMGTIIRTAEAAGADCIVMSGDCADIYSPKVVRSTMGSIFRMNFFVADIRDAAEELMKNGVQVCAACLDADEKYSGIEHSNRCAYIIGNEAKGISDRVLELPLKKVKIEMKGKVESLNAAVSLAILLFEHIR